MHTADGFVELGSVDGRYLSTEVAGGMAGRMLGVTCTSGRVVVRGSRHHDSDSPEDLSPSAENDLH